MTAYTLVILGVVLNVAAQIALKSAVRGHALSFGEPAALLAFALNPLIWLGLALYGASMVNWMVVLSRLDLGVAYPLMSLGFILTFVVGIVLFREPWSPTRFAGVAVIMLGVFLLTRPVSTAAA